MAQAEITGLFQWLEFALAGYIGTDPSGLGVVDGGNLELPPNTRRRLGIGGTEHRRGGLVIPGGTATFYVTATNEGLLGYCQRASYPRGALTELDFAGGGDGWDVTYTTAVITTWSIDYAQDEGLKATVNWQSLLAEEGETGGTMDAETNQDFEDYEFVCAFEEEEYGVNAFSISGNNNVTFKGAADTKVADTLRFPTHYVYGVEDLTMSLTTDRPIAKADLGLLDDCLPTDLGFVATGTNCIGDVVVLTLTDLAPADPLTFGLVDPNTPAGWGYGFMGSAADGSLGFALTPGT